MAAFATAGLIAWAVARKTASLELGLFCGLLYPVSSIVFAWVPYQRVDALAVLFAVGAYVAAEKARPGLAVSALLVGVGSLVKPTVAVAAIPIFIYLLLGKRYRDAAAYATVVCVLGAVLWWIVDRQSDGYYLTGVIRANLNRVDVRHGLRLAMGFIQCPAVLIGILVSAWLIKNAPGKAFGCVYCVGFTIGSLFAAVAASKEGASINYYLEPCALAAVVIGRHGLSRVYATHGGRVVVGVGLLALVLVIPGVGDFPPGGDSTLPLETDHARVNEIFSAVEQPTVLADGRLIDVALSAGGRPMVNDPYVFRLMVDNGSLQATGLIDAVRQGRIDFLLLGRSIENHRLAIGHSVQRWPPEVLDAMQQNYRLVSEGAGMFVYEKKGTQLFSRPRRMKNPRQERRGCVWYVQFGRRGYAARRRRYQPMATPNVPSSDQMITAEGSGTTGPGSRSYSAIPSIGPLLA